MILYTYPYSEWLSFSTIHILLFLLYLSWDSYEMVFGKHRTILYRTDLMIHHVISFLFTAGIGVCYMPTFGSKSLFVETLSSMNYIWRRKRDEMKLYYYRLFILLFIRDPYIIVMIYRTLSDPDTMYTEIANRTNTSIRSCYLTVAFIHGFFLVYDMILLNKIIGIIRYRRKNLLKSKLILKSHSQ